MSKDDAIESMMHNIADENEDDVTQIVVRLSRSFWHDKNGAYQRTTLRYLKRHTKGFNVFDDDCDQVGADRVLSKIIDLHKFKDGIYRLTMCNERRDWETGYVEDWDYALAPYKIEAKA